MAKSNIVHQEHIVNKDKYAIINIDYFLDDLISSIFVDELFFFFSCLVRAQKRLAISINRHLWFGITVQLNGASS